jgi:cardiolipin synthase
MVAGNELTVFVEWPALLEAMLGDIGRARGRVWVETYIFADDEGGRRFAEALKERARAGVDVRVHYDAVGSAMTPGAFFSDLAAAGVKVHAYHTLWEGFKRFNPLRILNRRDHRKLLVVDEAAGYFGGMNIIDNAEPVRRLTPPRLAQATGWRDVHLRLAGPQQGQLAESFERSWCRAHGRHKARRPRVSLRAQLRQLEGRRGVEESIHFFDSGPRGPLSRAARVYTGMVRRAQRQITLAMAYFIPVGGVLRALLAARKRGVGVRVIVPGKSDVPVVQRVTAYLYDRLIRRGFRVYERQRRMLHSKVMIVDELYTLVGSANLDPRSLYINLEFLAVIRSAELARQMQQVCRFEMEHSRRITMADCRGIGRWERLVNRLAWMVRWWL